MDLLLFLIAAAVGALVKLTDSQTDEKIFFFTRGQYITGIAAGILGGVLLASDARLTALFAGVLLGLLLTGKADRKAHQLAMAATLATIAVLGIQRPDAPSLLIFAAAAMGDELLNDWQDRRRRAENGSSGILAIMAENRLILETAALAVSALTGEWTYFLAVIAFDVGYLSAKHATKKANPAIGSLGNHLAIDLFDCSTRRLEDEKLLKAFLEHFAKAMGMRMITKPIIKRVNNEGDEGLSGFVVIAESHVSVHTFPRIHSCNVDLFSCKDFDMDAAEAAVAKWFSARVVRTHRLERGERF